MVEITIDEGNVSYDDRDTDVDMPDGAEELEKPDPDHSNKVLKGTYRTFKPYHTVLELGAGQGRVSKAVLFNYFGVVDMLEPSDKMRARAIARMRAEGKKYGNTFKDTVQAWVPDTKYEVDAVWI